MTLINLIAFSSRSSHVPQSADGFLPDAFFPQFAANKKRPKPTATSANLLILLYKWCGRSELNIPVFIGIAGDL